MADIVFRYEKCRLEIHSCSAQKHGGGYLLMLELLQVLKVLEQNLCILSLGNDKLADSVTSLVSWQNMENTQLGTGTN